MLSVVFSLFVCRAVVVTIAVTLLLPLALKPGKYKMPCMSHSCLKAHLLLTSPVTSGCADHPVVGTVSQLYD